MKIAQYRHTVLSRGKSAFIYFVATLTVWSIFASTVLAQSNPPIKTPPTTTNVALKNPLKIGTINELLEAILGIVIVLATPIIVFFIIYAGFLYVTARGNPEQIKQATQALTYAVIGGVIILGAFAIATIVKNIVSSF